MKYISFSTVLMLSIGCFLAVLPGCKLGTEEKKIGLFVVDVLDKNMYDHAHIAGSTQVDLDKLDAFAHTLDKNAEIVFYCTNYFCTSSSYAARTLTALGFKHVWAYEGGIAEWYQQGLPVEGAVKTGATPASYLTKVIEAPAEHEEGVTVISTSELAHKMGLK